MSLRPKIIFITYKKYVKCRCSDFCQFQRILYYLLEKRWRPHWFPKKCCLQPTKKLENIQIYIHTHVVNLLLNKMFSSLKFKSDMINACILMDILFYFDIKFRDLTYFLIRNRVVRNLTLKVLALNFSLAYYFVSLYGLRPKKNSQ